MTLPLSVSLLVGIEICITENKIQRVLPLKVFILLTLTVSTVSFISAAINFHSINFISTNFKSEYDTNDDVQQFVGRKFYLGKQSKISVSINKVFEFILLDQLLPPKT